MTTEQMITVLKNTYRRTRRTLRTVGRIMPWTEGALSGNGIAAHWFTGRVNFGDLLTPPLLRYYGFTPIQYSSSFGIPNAWISLPGKLKGGDFKFRDYFSAIGMDHDPRYLDGRERLSSLLKYSHKPPDAIEEVKEGAHRGAPRKRSGGTTGPCRKGLNRARLHRIVPLVLSGSGGGIGRRARLRA